MIRRVIITMFFVSVLGCHSPNDLVEETKVALADKNQSARANGVVKSESSSRKGRDAQAQAKHIAEMRKIRSHFQHEGMTAEKREQLEKRLKELQEKSH